MKVTNAERLQQEFIANALMERQALLQKFLDPRRDLNKECGYPDTITTEMLEKLYERNGIAARVVDMFPDECWQSDPEVIEDPEGDMTTWEELFVDLEEQHGLFESMNRVDCLSGVGRYGILLLGIDDGLALDKPAVGIDPKTGLATVTAGKKVTRKLLYVRAFSEGVLDIQEWERDRTSPRFGQPKMYAIRMANDMDSKGSNVQSSPDSTAVNVHWTRVVHVADNLKNSLVFGRERMKDVFNRLADLDKILGGSGEMFWKGGFPGLSIESTPNAQGTATMSATDLKAVRRQMFSYMNGMQRYLALTGMTAKSLAPQIADPTNAFVVAIKAICISKGYPYRIFMGTEESQMAGEQDEKNWSKRVTKRRVKHVSSSIVRPVVDRLIALGVLPFTDYTVTWPEIYQPNPKDRAETASKVTDALIKYISGNADILIQPLEFLTYVLGFDTQTASGILEKAQLTVDGTLERPEPDPVEVAAAAAKQRGGTQNARKKRRMKMRKVGGY